MNISILIVQEEVRILSTAFYTVPCGSFPVSYNFQYSPMEQKSDSIIGNLEAQAENILHSLALRNARRPLIVEFAGSPKAGKTTAINIVSLFLRRNGFTVEIFPERASISPLIRKKGHPDFNVWVSCGSLQGLIEAVEKHIDVFFWIGGYSTRLFGIRIFHLPVRFLCVMARKSQLSSACRDGLN